MSIYIKGYPEFNIIDPIAVDITTNNMKAIQTAIEDGFLVNQPLLLYGMEGLWIYPVMLAICYNHIETIELLVSKKAKLDIKKEHAFLYALKYSSMETVKAVLKLGAKSDVKDRIGKNMYSYALETGETKIEKYELLQELGYSVKDYASDSAFMAMILYDYETLDYFISHGLDMNRISSGVTMLQNALYMDNLPMFRYLLEKGADPAVTDNNKANTYDIALKMKKYNFLTLILKAGNQVYSGEEIAEKLRKLVALKMPKQLIDIFKNDEYTLSFSEDACVVDKIKFVSLMRVEEIDIEKKSRWIISRQIGDYPDLLLLWNKQNTCIAYYDTEHKVYQDLGKFKEFMEKPAYYINMIFRSQSS